MDISTSSVWSSKATRSSLFGRSAAASAAAPVGLAAAGSCQGSAWGCYLHWSTRSSSPAGPSPSKGRQQSARPGGAAGPAPPPPQQQQAPSQRDEAEVPADVAAMAPHELRKQLMAMRAEFAEAAGAAQRAEHALLEEQRRAHEAEAAFEARFEDVTGFMEGLLKGLKAENTRLKAELDGARCASSRAELDEFLSIEEEVEEELEEAMAPPVSSPLKEARMMRLMIVDGLEDLAG